MRRKNLDLFTHVSPLSLLCQRKVFNMVCFRVPWMISIMFVGRLGEVELASCAMATTLANVTGMSVLQGLSSAQSTLSAQVCSRKLHVYASCVHHHYPLWRQKNPVTMNPFLVVVHHRRRLTRPLVPSGLIWWESFCR
jgi:hypothetical protein